MVSGQCSSLSISQRHVNASGACRKKLRELEREFWCWSSLLDGACSSSSLLWRRKRCWSPLWCSISAFFPRWNSDLEVYFWRSCVLQTRNLRVVFRAGQWHHGHPHWQRYRRTTCDPKAPSRSWTPSWPKGFRARRPWRQELAWESKRQPLGKRSCSILILLVTPTALNNPQRRNLTILRWICFTATHGELCGMTVEHTEYLPAWLLISCLSLPLSPYHKLISPKSSLLWVGFVRPSDLNNRIYSCDDKDFKIYIKSSGGEKLWREIRIFWLMSGEKEINKGRKKSSANAVWRRQTHLGRFSYME